MIRLDAYTTYSHLSSKTQFLVILFALYLLMCLGSGLRVPAGSWWYHICALLLEHPLQRLHWTS